MERCLSKRARKPSSASVSPAAMKEDEAQLVVPLEDRSHQERRQADAHEREQVGSAAEGVQAMARASRGMANSLLNDGNNMGRMPRSHFRTVNDGKALRLSRQSAAGTDLVNWVAV